MYDQRAFLSADVGDKATTIVRAKRDVRAAGETPRPFRLNSGWLAQYFDDEDGKRQILGIMLPSEAWRGTTTYGMMALSDARISYLDPHEVSRIDREDGWPREGVDSLKSSQEWLIAFISRASDARLAYFLHHIFSRVHGLDRCEAAHAVSIPLNQADIASACGVTPVHINRVIKRLKDGGIVEVRGQTWRILNYPALLALFGKR